MSTRLQSAQKSSYSRKPIEILISPPKKRLLFAFTLIDFSISHPPQSGLERNPKTLKASIMPSVVFRFESLLYLGDVVYG